MWPSEDEQDQNQNGLLGYPVVVRVKPIPED
jgi:hypothetical protein